MRDYLEIAEEMYEYRHGEELPESLIELLHITNDLTVAAGGRLMSRQATAVVVLMWEMTQTP